MYKNFNEVVCIMSVASVLKVKECLSSAEWLQTTVSNALTDSDLNVDTVYSVSDGKNLESVNFHCIVPFEANEIPGIIAPFYCCLDVEASFDKRTGQHSLNVGYGPRGMLSVADYETVYDVEYLFNEFCKTEPELDINQFVSNDFNFCNLCKVYGVAKIISAAGANLYDEE